MHQRFQAVGQSMRLPFLVLTPVCLLLGYASASLRLARVDYFDFSLVIIAGLASHISVNLFNEFFDFKSGLDAKTQRTPFSGGSGSLVVQPEAAAAVLYAACFCLALTVVIGGYFVAVTGLALLPLGLVGVATIISYTQWINRHPWLCLLAPGLAFGPLMVMGTDYVLTGQYSYTAFYLSLLPFFLSNNLLLLNQLPDISADESVGRRQFPSVYGVKASIGAYGAFIAASLITVLAGVTHLGLPFASLLSVIPLLLALPVLHGLRHGLPTPASLTRILAMNVALSLLTPLVFAVSIIVG